MAELVLKDAQRVSKKLEQRPGLKDSDAKTAEPVPIVKPKAGGLTLSSSIPSVLAGSVHGTIVLMSFASFAFVIFGNSEHPELQAAFGLGISQQLLSASLLIGVLTFTGFFPFTMGGPTPPAALLVADVVRTVADNVKDPSNMVPTAMIAIMLVTLLTGLLLVTLSATKTAVYAQQLPYPVLAGFLGGVGSLLMRAAIGILLDLKLKWFCIPKDFDDVKQLDALSATVHFILGLCVALLFCRVYHDCVRLSQTRALLPWSCLPCSCFQL
jgi:MFS superfamily sulfate permease-like transporter